MSDLDRTSAGHVRGVEGIRAIAASSIVIYHVWVASGPSENPVSLGPLSDHVLPNLQAGVILFFTLSGFLLYRRFAQAILRGEDTPRFSTYFRSRAWRILPAYWVALTLTGLALRTVLIPRGGLHVGGLQEDWPLFPLSAVFLQNVSPGRFLGGIGPAWSLVVEAAFYLALPLLVLAAVGIARGATTRAHRRVAALVPAAIMLVIGMTGKAVSFALVSNHQGPSGWSNDWQSVVERGFWGQADLFTFGLVVAVVAVEVGDGALTLPRGWRTGAYVVGGSLLLATAMWLPNEDSQRGQLSHFLYGPSMAIACALLLAAIVLPSPRSRENRVVNVLEARPLVWLGLISYSLFLWHLPVIYWVRFRDWTFSGREGLLINIFLLGGLSVLIAAISFYLVERPALRRTRRGSRRETLTSGEQNA